MKIDWMHTFCMLSGIVQCFINVVDSCDITVKYDKIHRWRSNS